MDSSCGQREDNKPEEIHRFPEGHRRIKVGSDVTKTRCSTRMSTVNTHIWCLDVDPFDQEYLGAERLCWDVCPLSGHKYLW